MKILWTFCILSLLANISYGSEDECLKDINKVNQKYANINSFTASVYGYYGKINGIIEVKFRGNLQFQKPHNVRFIAKSAGLTHQSVLDIGSNNEIFWAWTKNSRTLRYGKYNRIQTLLWDNYLSPDILIEILGVSGVNTENSKLSSIGDSISVYTKWRELHKTVLISKTGLAPYRYDIRTDYSKTVLLSQIKSITGDTGIPTEIFLVLPNKDLQMTLHFSNIVVNGPINSELFTILPNITPKLNITP